MKIIFSLLILIALAGCVNPNNQYGQIAVPTAASLPDYVLSTFNTAKGPVVLMGSETISRYYIKFINQSEIYEMGNRLPVLSTVQVLGDGSIVVLATIVYTPEGGGNMMAIWRTTLINKNGMSNLDTAYSGNTAMEYGTSLKTANDGFFFRTRSPDARFPMVIVNSKGQLYQIKDPRLEHLNDPPRPIQQLAKPPSLNQQVQQFSQAPTPVAPVIQNKVAHIPYKKPSNNDPSMPTQVFTPALAEISFDIDKADTSHINSQQAVKLNIR